MFWTVIKVSACSVLTILVVYCLITQTPYACSREDFPLKVWKKLRSLVLCVTLWSDSIVHEKTSLRLKVDDSTTPVICNMAVANTGSWVQPINMHLLHFSFSCASKVPTLEFELKKVPQNVILRTIIVHGSCGVDAIKRKVLRTMLQELWNVSCGPKTPYVALHSLSVCVAAICCMLTARHC